MAAAVVVELADRRAFFQSFLLQSCRLPRPHLLEESVSGATVSSQPAARRLLLLDHCRPGGFGCGTRRSTLLHAVLGDVAEFAPEARWQVWRLQDHEVLVLARGFVHGAMAFVQCLLLDTRASTVRPHDGSSIQSPSNLDLGALRRPRMLTTGLPPGANRHLHVQGPKEAKRRGMVVVMPPGVAMATAIVHEPSHALSRMLVHKQDRIQGHTHDATDVLESLGGSWLGEGRHPKFQVPCMGQERPGSRSLRDPLGTQAAARAASTASTAGAAVGTAGATSAAGATGAAGAARGAVGTTSTAGAAGTTGTANTTGATGTTSAAGGTAPAGAAGSHVFAIVEIHTRMVTKCKHVGAIHLGLLVVEAKTTPGCVRAIRRNVQHAARDLQCPCHGV